jgi:hypothetical protein
MWKKLGESLSGDNEEQEESWLGEDSGALCSLSTTQVLSKLFTQDLAVWDFTVAYSVLSYATFGC